MEQPLKKEKIEKNYIFDKCTFKYARPPNTLKDSIQLDGQREVTHNNINRDKATCPDKVVPRNNNKAKSSSAKETIAPEDGQLLVTETCRVTWDTNILMF
jgi:hypothetical protein